MLQAALVPNSWDVCEFVKHIASVVEENAFDHRESVGVLDLIGRERIVKLPLGEKGSESSFAGDAYP